MVDVLRAILVNVFSNDLLKLAHQNKQIGYSKAIVW